MFLVDNQPEGIRTLELSNSTVLCTIVPRQLLPKFSARKEAGRPGVYLLTDLGPDSTDQPRLYIGEGDPVRDRLNIVDPRN